MVYFITGSTGFIGIHLIKLLQKKEEVKKVYLLVRNPQKLRKRLSELDSEKFIVIKNNLLSLKKLPEDTTHIIHLAGITKSHKKDDYFKINSIATEKLAKLSLNLKGLKKFLFISSLAAAGPSKDCTKIKESINPEPVSFYGKSKLEGEQRILKYKDKLPIVILRPPAVYGEWDTDFLEAIKLIKKGLSLNIKYSSEKRILSWIYAEDIVRAIDHLLNLEIPSGEIFFISEDRDLKWSEVEEIVAKNLNSRLKIKITFPFWFGKLLAFSVNILTKITGKNYIFNKDKINEIKYRCWICSNKKLKEYGFSPQFTFENKISDVIEWYINKGWL